jgi:hypothetical protein
MHVNELGPHLERHAPAKPMFDIVHEAASREFTSVLERANNTPRKPATSSAPQTA